MNQKYYYYYYFNSLINKLDKIILQVNGNIVELREKEHKSIDWQVLMLIFWQRLKA